MTPPSGTDLPTPPTRATAPDPEAPTVGTHPAAPATCPRCGYDQSGAMATWTDRCPLLGLCPECGLDFEWSRVIRETRDPLSWSFEHAPRPEHRKLRASVYAFTRTLTFAIMPWRLWHRMRMEYPMRPARLGGFVVCAVVLLVFTLILARDVITLVNILSWQRLNSITNLPTWQVDQILRQLLLFGASPRDVVPAGLWWTIWWFLIPPLFVLLPHSLRRAKVRKAHFVRIFLYSLVLFPVALAALQVPRTTLALVSIWNHTTRAEQYIIWSCVTVLQTLFFGSLLAFFWSRACRDYLRLPNSLAIGIALSLMAFLLTLGMYVLPIALGLVNRSSAWPETT